MFKLTAQLCASTVAPLVVAATHVAKSVTWLVTALPQIWAPPLAVVEAMLASAAVTMSPTTGLLHAINVVDPTIMPVTVKLKP